MSELTERLTQRLQDIFVAPAAQGEALGADALGALIAGFTPVLVGQLAQASHSPEGMTRLLTLFNDHGLPHPDEASTLLDGGHRERLAVLGGQLLDKALGGQAGPLETGLAAASALNRTEITRLLSLATPFALALLRKDAGGGEVSAAAIARLFGHEAPPSAAAAALAGAEGVDLRKPAAPPPAPAADAPKSGWSRLLPWLALAAIAVIALLQLKSCDKDGASTSEMQMPAATPAPEQPAPLPASAPAASVTAAPTDASAPAAAREAPAPVSLYYDRSVTRVPDDAPRLLAPIVAFLKAHPDARVEIRGYHDRDGAQALNTALAAGRAEAARVYLEKAGVPAAQIEEVTPASTLGDDADNRRARRADLTITLP
ncbi:OmpA family protein [Crenobacter caeni]|uniref:OmpA family protein n=1 Tax=Crenobacter caeni TaxID=2705474 RepID=A0A6B2KRY6_9NEIS|nr:OmpA family protein [Crenobacter caeni]NDV12821.1 OmpA family protein [Crenobacter caeni]